MEKFIGKVRPQIFLALVGLITISILALREGQTEIGVGCIAGIIALSKDVLQSDA
jgi:precorrin-6B methylase 2